MTCIGRDDNFRTLPQGNLEQLNWIWHLHQNYVVSFFKLCIELRLNWNTKAIKKTTEILSGEDHHGCVLSLSISLYNTSTNTGYFMMKKVNKNILLVAFWKLISVAFALGKPTLLNSSWSVPNQLLALSVIVSTFYCELPSAEKTEKVKNLLFCSQVDVWQR